MELFRQEYWSGLLFPPSGELPDPGIKPVSLASPALQEDSLPTTLIKKKKKMHMRRKSAECIFLDSSLASFELNAIFFLVCSYLCVPKRHCSLVREP